jgi:hypothetical protein
MGPTNSIQSVSLKIMHYIFEILIVFVAVFAFIRANRCDPISVQKKEKNDDMGFPPAFIDGIQQPRDGTISGGNKK